MAGGVVVAGVGMIPFAKPGTSDSWDVMAAEATRFALADSGLDYGDIQQAYVGYVYGESTAGQSALYEVGLSGIPVFNVNNNCSTGSTALFLARQAVESGVVDCALALGFEEMPPGALGRVFNDRKPPMQMFGTAARALQPVDPNAPGTAQLFGGAGREYQERYGAPAEMFAEVSVKARRHAANNPFALFTAPLTVEEVMASKHLYGPVTRYMACPPTCGAAAAVLVSPAFARRNGIAGAEILAQSLVTDTATTFEPPSMMSLVGYDMAERGSRQAYEMAGIGPEEVDVAELHDCFAPAEVLAYEALGLTAPGGAEAFVRDGRNSYGGEVVTNPSGGLLSKGHPLGATGLAQCAELVWQMRGAAGARQVEGARIGLQHNLGLGGACVVTLYRTL